MSELYLIAHRVRGQPAFDVATRMECPLCTQEDGDIPGCYECDDLGYWWIIPTSGHRAHPYWSKSIAHVSREATFCYCEPGEDPFVMIDPMPLSLPDHYPTRSTPTISLAEALGLTKPRPLPPIIRRI